MPDELLALARSIAGEARGDEQVEVYALRSRDTDVKVFGGEVESLSSAVVEGVGVRVVCDGRQGYAWSGSLAADVLAGVLADARDNASFGSEDEFAGLATLADAGAGPAADLDLWHDDVLSVPATDKVALTLELERATLAADSRLRGVESAAYGDAALESAIASSTGVEATARRTVASVSVTALAGESPDTQTGSGFSVGRSYAELDLGEAVTDAVERSTRMLGARQPPSQRLPVVLDPLVTRSLVSLIGAALNGEAILKGRSMFVDRLGDDVAAPGVTLVDDPTNAAAFGASEYDAEGVPTRRVPLVVSGRLDALLQNAYTARRSSTGTTGSAVRGGFKSPPGVGARALSLAPGSLSAEEILGSVPLALYVQSVSGLHSGTNTVSGDFSVGAEGLMVRDGQLAEPVRELTIASTLQRMLHDIVHVGTDVRWLPGGAAGMTVLLGEMSLSGS